MEKISGKAGVRFEYVENKVHSKIQTLTCQKRKEAQLTSRKRRNQLEKTKKQTEKRQTKDRKMQTEKRTQKNCTKIARKQKEEI